MKKARFSSRLKLGLAILTILVITQLIGGKILSNYYLTEWTGLINEMLASDVENDDSEFRLIHRELSSLVVNNTALRELPQRRGEGLSDYSTRKALQIVRIQQALQNLADLFGQEYYFWVYDEKTKTFVDYGNNKYEVRIDYRSRLLNELQKKENVLLRKEDWFVEEASLVTIIRGHRIYAGCMTTVDDYLSTLTELKVTDLYRFYLLDGSGAVVEGRECNYGNITRTEDYHPVSSKSVSEREFRIVFEHGNFELLYQLDNSIIRRIHTFEILALVLTVAYLFVIVFITLYSQRHLFRPLMKLSKKMDEFSRDIDFNNITDVSDLSKVGFLLNTLASRVEELQVEIYRREIERQKTELDFAQMQIRPHFFINCLNVIFSLAQINRNDAVQNLCYDLSEYMRRLFRDGTQLISLSDEIQLIGHYLNAAGYIYGQSYRYSINVDQELESMQIPPLVIQTFIENSIKHSLKTALKTIEIEVKACEFVRNNRSFLRITIQDTGGGFDETIMQQLNSHMLEKTEDGHHIGIRNVIERMDILYPDNYEIEFANQEKGARVTVLIPYIQTADVGKEE
jgi:hypothetical protein